MVSSLLRHLACTCRNCDVVAGDMFAKSVGRIGANIARLDRYAQRAEELAAQLQPNQ